MKCAICGEGIEGRYITDAWHQTIHDFHAIENCFSCGRLVSPKNKHLVDGRIVCPICTTSIVSTPNHIKWVEDKVRKILSSKGVSDIPQTIPIEIISAKRMAQLHHLAKINPTTYGLTSTMKSVSLFHSSCQHTIYILDNLPKIFFAGVLAHEFLHAWQNERQISLPPLYCEGFCNMGSLVVYDSIHTEIALHYIKQLEQDPDPIYGEGFRKVRNIYSKCGGRLQDTMSHLMKSGKIR